MSYYCECDERPEFCNETLVRASRKLHCCDECGTLIHPGTGYMRHVGKWDGAMYQFKYCTRCQGVLDFRRAHGACFCWNYGSVLDDALSIAADANEEAPGLYFGVARRVVRARRAATEGTP